MKYICETDQTNLLPPQNEAILYMFEERAQYIHHHSISGRNKAVWSLVNQQQLFFPLLNPRFEAMFMYLPLLFFNN